MSVDFAAINYWAVLVAAVASFLIGGLWYAVLFGKAWARVYAYTEAQLAEMSRHPGRTFPLLFACDVVMALAVALLVGNLGLGSAAQGAALGVLLWLGVAVATGFSVQLGHNRPLRGWLLDTGPQLIGLVLTGTIIAAWR